MDMAAPVNYVIFKFEVFKYDTLFGCIVVNDNDGILIQTWDFDAIKSFWECHSKDIWVGHNNVNYDNIILNSILKNKDPYIISQKITSKNKVYCALDITSYDTMRGQYSLDLPKLVVGKDITNRSFNVDKQLTKNEKSQIEAFNLTNLYQIRQDFTAQFDEFSIRFDIIKEFNLPMNALTISSTSLAAEVLGAKAIDNIEEMYVKPQLPQNIILDHQEVIDFYLNEDFRNKKSITVTLCGAEHTIAAGGIHAAQKKVHIDRAMYFDVSGYYNLVMINCGLLPRTMPEESRERYISMYHEQLRLKKINPRKRAMYKVILLCVFGAMTNEHTDFYDPQHGSLVTVLGELYLVDLLEKLEPYGTCIQSNTDGIVFEPYNWRDKNIIVKIVEEWEKRTGFVIKQEEIHNLWQRDVNNYCFDDNGTAVTKGEAVKHYNSYSNPIWNQAWSAKEPAIIAKGIVDYLLYNITPEQTIETNKHNLVLYQYVCKLTSFDYMMLEKTDQSGLISRAKLQDINRAFASNDNSSIKTIVKYKNENGKTKHLRIPSLPTNVFIANGNITDARVIDSIVNKIDYQYYIDRIYERLGEFVE